MTSKCQSIGELGTLLWKKIEKNLTILKKLKVSQMLKLLRQNSGKLKNPLGIIIFFGKNVPQCRKKTQSWDPLVSPGIVCYADKKEKLFWFCWQGQMVQFDTIKFCRTWRTISATSDVSNFFEENTDEKP